MTFVPLHLSFFFQINKVRFVESNLNFEISLKKEIEQNHIGLFQVLMVYLPDDLHSLQCLTQLVKNNDKVGQWVSIHGRDILAKIDKCKVNHPNRELFEGSLPVASKYENLAGIEALLQTGRDINERYGCI